jgi:hypothetical protein
MDTSSFINALRRFIAVRGPIRQLRSDRGTNFVGAINELGVSTVDSKQVTGYLQAQNCDYIDFKLNCPNASHMGGVWQRQIRTVRSVLSSLLNQAGHQLDDESLRTLMCEAMAIVNSRPLTTDNLCDPNSLEPLTPNHLLTLKSNVILPPPGEFQQADVYSRKRWRRVQHLANEFWTRWRREYLLTLQERQKWNKPSRNAKPGDVVVVTSDNVPRSQWQLARVVETYPGEDGRVRKVKLAIGNPNLNSVGKRIAAVSYLERPVHKLILLLESEE